MAEPGEFQPNSNTPSSNGPASSDPVELRRRLVNYLIGEGAIRSPLLANAFSEVPREIFLPDNVPLQRVYSDDAIVVKWDENNFPSSSSSQPILMADMLEALRLEPGLRVLEIGAGVGYNAALMADWVGDGALVTTVDLDPAMAQIAGDNLRELARRTAKNFDQVTVVASDGSAGYPPNAPYDRIIVTVQQWEIAPAWVEQLRVGGILLLPLTVSTHLWGGLIPALQKQADGSLVGVGGSFGGFMPMRGEMAHPAAPHGRFALLPLNPARAWPDFGPEAPDSNLPEPQLLLSNSEIMPDLEGFLEQPGVFAAGPEEPLELDFSPEFSPGLPESRAQREVSYAFYGFSFVLVLAAQDRIFSLVLVSPLSEADSGQNNRNAPGWSKDGWQYETRGLALVEPAGSEGGYDMALLLSPNPSNHKHNKLIQGWRLRPVEAGNLPSPTPNRAVEKVREAWQTWQTMGRPSPVRYRPVAYPSPQPQPVPGYVLPRRFYNLVLPFQA
jgi:protein-L-isoaspartate(D-aspartate) O-methyltransferase